MCGGRRRDGRRRRVVAELLDGGVNRAVEAQRQGGGARRSCGAVEGAGWQSGGRLGGKSATGGGGTEVELREGGDGAAAGKLRGGGGTAGRGGEDFFQCRGLNYPRKTRRMEVKNIEKLGSEFRQFLVKTQKIANEIFEVLGKFSRSQSKFGIAWTKFKVVSGLRPRPPAHPKKRRVFAPALKVGLT